jgi:hypothetical protein
MTPSGIEPATTHSGDILTNDNSHNMKLDRLLPTAAEMKYMRKTAG